MTKMNPEIKARWVAALRSGEYKQGRGQLRNERNEFCCLGVLCNLHAQAHPEVAAKQHDHEFYMGDDGLLPPAVQRWAGLAGSHAEVSIDGDWTTLASHNDRGRAFAEIADAIEAQL